MKAWSRAWNTAEVPVPQAGPGGTGPTARVIQVRRTGKGCLSYLIGGDGQAVVIDASVEPEVYMSLAATEGWTITAVLDTHVHADHLSRSRALAAACSGRPLGTSTTDATVYLPAQQRVSYPFSPLRDGDKIAVGSARITVLATPGHTPESVSYLLAGGPDDPVQPVFTGDTLFLAGVGRPDLEASEDEARARAHLLYHSLQRLRTLPPETIILPAHTSEPVSFDGQPVTASLAQVQRQVAALHLAEDAFVDSILARIPPTPPNHTRIVALNEAGILPSGDLTDLEAGANRCAVS
jgi:glyoxylase-like metal-dependent hydrolase (beta-lactamase superfamily II)